MNQTEKSAIFADGALAPCPFCNGVAITDFIEGASYAIKCTVCRARTTYLASASAAVAAWNQRAVAPFSPPAVRVSDEDYALMVKRYEDAGDVQNADIIRKQWAARGAQVQAQDALENAAASQACSSASVAADPLEAYSKWMERRGPLGAGAIPDRIFIAGWAAGQRAGTRAATEYLSAMLWLYRRLPRHYGRLPHIEQPIECLARQIGTEVAGYLAERGPAPAQSKGDRNAQ